MKEFIIRYWIQVLFSGVLTALGIGMKKITQEFKREMLDQKSIKLGVQAILRDRLIQSYNYHSSSGFCAIHDRDNIINMYNQYHALGANGVIDSLISELLELPMQNCKGGNKNESSI